MHRPMHTYLALGSAAQVVGMCVHRANLVMMRECIYVYTYINSGRNCHVYQTALLHGVHAAHTLVFLVHVWPADLWWCPQNQCRQIITRVLFYLLHLHFSLSAP